MTLLELHDTQGCEFFMTNGSVTHTHQGCCLLYVLWGTVRESIMVRRNYRLMLFLVTALLGGCGSPLAPDSLGGERLVCKDGAIPDHATDTSTLRFVFRIDPELRLEQVCAPPPTLGQVLGGTRHEG